VPQAPPVIDSQPRARSRAGSPRQWAEHRRELHDLFRLMAVYRETAAMLESRAERSANPVLADVLRERAADRRRRADHARDHLLAEGVLGIRVPREPGPAD
jgi:hypothetical protein